MKYLQIVILLLLCIASPNLSTGSGFQPWSEKVFEHVEQEYGKQAAKRVRFLHDLMLENQDLPVMEKLELVNTTLNKLPWIADSQHWKSADYWATPLETIATFGGDCEDMAIVKWVVLSNLGIDANHLRLGYVIIKQTGETHMVLLYLEEPAAPAGKRGAWVLDNYVQDIKRGAERTDLLAVYSTDKDGNLVLVADDGKNRTVKGEYKERKMKKLEDLKEKIRQTRQQFTEINEGRPLFPGDA